MVTSNLVANMIYDCKPNATIIIVNRLQLKILASWQSKMLDIVNRSNATFYIAC